MLEFVSYRRSEWSDLEAFFVIAAVTAVDALEWLTAAGYWVFGAADCCSRNVGALVRA